MEQKEMESKASSNLECLKRESRKHHSAPAGRRPGSFWGLSRILHTVQQNWMWMLTFKSTLCALRLLSYYEYLVKKKRKKEKGKKNPTGWWVRRPEFLLWDSLLPIHITVDAPFSTLSLHVFICKGAIPALLPAQGSLEHLKIRCVETVCKIELHIKGMLDYEVFWLLLKLEKNKRFAHTFIFWVAWRRVSSAPMLRKKPGGSGPAEVLF